MLKKHILILCTCSHVSWICFLESAENKPRVQFTFSLEKIEYFKILVGFYASMFSKSYLEHFNRMSNVFCSLLVRELLWELIWISYPVTSVTRQGPTRFVASSIMMKISALNHFIFQRNLYWLWDHYAHLCSFTFTSYENMQI